MDIQQSIRRLLGGSLVLIATFSHPVLAEYTSHGISLYGEPKYTENFSNFDYANPNAPKQGELVMAEMGSFDSLHQFIDLGKKPRGLFWLYDRLTVRGHDKDEIKTRYGWLAEKMTIADDYSSVIYFLRKEAKFSDGYPVTAEDVAHSLNLYRESGLSNIKSRFKMVKSVEVIDPLTIKINFGGDGSRLQILNSGNLPVLPKHIWQHKDFTQPSLDIPIGSGPYKVTSVDPGRGIVYELRDDYWGKNLPVNKGKYNFKNIKVEYFRDRNAAVQALKTNDVNYIAETNLLRWNKLYQGDVFNSGTVVKDKINYDAPSFVTAMVFNLRQAKFADRRTREALVTAFDFEWLNKKAFNNQYTRATSLFNNSFLAAEGLPTAQEKAILTPLSAQLPEQVLSSEFTLPSTDGSGRNRKNLLTAQALLKEAGWKVKNNKLVHSVTGEVMTINFLLPSPTMKPAIGAYIQTLKKLGISSNITIKTGTEYYKLLMQRKFDMTPSQYKVRIPPNTELRSSLKSEFAGVASSYNISGIQDPAIDNLVEGLVQSDRYVDTQAYGRALDRVLKWNYYYLPLWARNFQLVAYQNYIEKPLQAPKYGYEVEFWWDERSK
ncbi:extracellular solute-binding protein [Moritella viscosa]|uniref:ABC transporter, periplasmic substrate-binding protein n=1 Tax=Moritella viscosa TaxID=80854 RepID=A0A1L0B1T5_9GAMM|nr:extracellular solute-binding protein [Moritella viscosa]SGY95741.1 ABC transporter, periplasmic substrate-binding protein [Moritella viscosa]SGZ01312.1 ABC transporter, periplasmic substrate-binding protein [Moritella viscosa]SGZ01726.1 ABC transporter, periplasmic substrate-binding protein [Moritella viscosa]SGZ07925.1 ABC transporter, periplasmic substrate-binding protein [Moritella viscosa]SGZ08062.1 ABC transporter, periplasmic substrate-binding protein [Moritella viscosa]